MDKKTLQKSILSDYLNQQQQLQLHHHHHHHHQPQQLYDEYLYTNNNIDLNQYLLLNNDPILLNDDYQHHSLNNLLTPFCLLSNNNDNENNNNNNNTYSNHPLFDINHDNGMNSDQVDFITGITTINNNDDNNNTIQSHENFQPHYNIINGFFMPTLPLDSTLSSPSSSTLSNTAKFSDNNSNQLIKIENNKNMKKKKMKKKKWDQIKKMIDYFTQSMLPIKINDTIDSTCFLDLVMEKARTHWCCIGFKVAPITIDLIRNWRHAPETIIYCIASITLVTIMDHRATEGYVKNAAMAFYEQATQKIDTFTFGEDDCIGTNKDSNDFFHPPRYAYNIDNGDGEEGKEEKEKKDNSIKERRQKRKAMTIQSYFCLSYTSNLLRLYEQQQTWGGLASVALRLKTGDVDSGYRPMNQAILLCWCRWYYIDAWLSLTLQRECLLPDQPPNYIMNAIQQAQDDTSLNYEHQSIFQFTILTRFMRKYIQAIQNQQLLDPITLRPTFIYYQITDELKKWYENISLPITTTKEEDRYQSRSHVHLHLCYHAMRLVVLYQFLSQEKPPEDDHLLMDGLETNLNILQSLQQLASQGCDQSTYHHMFFAIHNTASRIYQYKTNWQKWAKEQLQMNLILLKSTQAYVNDVFQMRAYAEKIEQQFEKMGLTMSNYYKTTLHSIQQLQELKQAEQKEKLLEKILIHLSKKKRKNNKKKKINETSDNADHLNQEEEVAALLNQYLKKQYQSISSFSSTNSSFSTNSSSTTPGIHVYKLSTNSTIKKPRLQKKNNTKQLYSEKKKNQQ
ncbi:hypothetical protein BJ944DRAFT_247759 [Cunninghamella echinulata]|nr:hypothetical protein BJ944DRAFT_247759 [Cunninghamella echinulata]